MWRDVPKILVAMVKRAVYYALAAGPFLLLGLIAINSRLRVNDWQFIEYGPETSARILAYSAPVSLVRERLGFRGQYQEEDVKGVMQVWLDGYFTGALKDIPPATTVEYGMTTVYQQILDAKQELMLAGLRTGDQLRSQGEFDRAAELYISTVEVAGIGKYSEFLAVTDAAVYQASALERLMAIAPELDELHRAEIAARLAISDADATRSFSHVVSRASANYRLDLARQHKTAVKIQIGKDDGMLAQADDPISKTIDEWRVTALTDGTKMPLFGRSRVALMHQTRLEQVMAETQRVFLGDAVLEASSD